ncbi:hypothetical protein Anapl_07845 [Anas platyrhynchos]|uniref:Uncharacterized protein n=1 Tax=Anas platyrhynchos TaxID=8839 RepID=R0JBD8_ANAPL|nr:hypothetical protein Anapl_07845 [Anas platyrhynchos]
MQTFPQKNYGGVMAKPIPMSDQISTAATAHAAPQQHLGLEHCRLLNQLPQGCHYFLSFLLSTTPNDSSSLSSSLPALWQPQALRAGRELPVPRARSPLTSGKELWSERHMLGITAAKFP